MKKLAMVFAFATSIFAAAGWGQNQGHVIIGEEVVANSRRHWENWEFAPGTLEISAAGEVRPRFFRREINAVEDIVHFIKLRPPEGVKKTPEEIELIDALDAGSNREDVAHVLDGDMTTYWEPDPPSGEIGLGAQWWFSVDLGRFVIAKKIVLKFVDEELGDPFLLFDVLVSNGTKPLANSRSPIPEYQTVRRTLSANKSQREFVVELPEDSELGGKGIRFVQVMVTGTDSSRAHEVSPEEYESLGTADQGKIEYYKRLSDGREVVVEAGTYALLEAGRQGSIRYFRREHPRLAELEVWTEGDEILIGTLERGGFVTATQTTALTATFDGDATSKAAFIYSFGQLRDPEGELFFDLGSFFWIDTQRVLYQGGIWTDYRLDFSDGNLAPDGSLKWITAVSRDPASHRAGTLTEGNDFKSLIARFFRVVWKQYETGTGVGGASAWPAEIQLYGEGFQPEVVLESDLVRLEGTPNLLSVEWDADTPPGTRVLIQTRTGNELSEILHYFKNDGTEVTEAQYNKLLKIFRGDIVAEQVPGGDWSDWSEPYEAPAGSPITSPSPRQFLKARATLLSTRPAVCATLREIRLKFGNPVAKGLRGEVLPFLVDSLGVERLFSFYIRPQFDSRDPGFDQLLLTGSTDMRFRLEGIYGGSEAELMAEGADLSALALSQVAVVPTRADSLQVSFAPILPRSGVEILRLDFRTALFSAGTLLRASLQNSGAGEGTWQRVDPGDASGQVASNTTTLVGAVKTKRLITDVAVLPGSFTPNGDGINDELTITFKVVRVGDDSPVEIQLFDLAGRRLRRIVERRGVSTGQYEVRWDGRDDQGTLVLPGIYYLRLQVDTDTKGASIEGEQILRTVAVVY